MLQAPRLPQSPLSAPRPGLEPWSGLRGRRGQSSMAGGSRSAMAGRPGLQTHAPSHSLPFSTAVLPFHSYPAFKIPLLTFTNTGFSLSQRIFLTKNIPYKSFKFTSTRNLQSSFPKNLPTLFLVLPSTNWEGTIVNAYSYKCCLTLMLLYSRLLITGQVIQLSTTRKSKICVYLTTF